ncbi:MAG: glycerol-3-phosphate 1-O-acyltransferase PlsY [Gammaproteobacteria bacterium]|nr:glycerol-3-phosphate 1-O-acyltransferase PlsY [Gammaproteobacteria bacterium]
MHMLATLISIIIAYLLGSISSAVLVCKGLGLSDPREAGSHNPGATNVLRLAGKKPAILVLVCDALKGTIAVLIAGLFGLTAFEVGLVAVAVVIGHMYPVFFKFRGGKGVATALGAYIGISWIVGGLALLTWLALAKLTKYSSLAAMVTVCLAPFYMAFIEQFNYLVPLLVIAALILYRHRDNITRLIKGEEPKIGSSSAEDVTIED